MSQPRLLLVSPAFHGYWQPIADALTRRGYAVSTHLYDENSPADRVQIKVVHELPERFGAPARPPTAHTRRALQALRAGPVEVLLVVKGDTLGPAFWDAARRVPRRALWLYDELRRTGHTDESLAAAGPIASYSPLDVAALSDSGLEAIHVPLAHDAHLPFEVRTAAEVVFVGACYPGREALLRYLARQGLPVRVYGRDWSSHPYDRLRTWRWRGLGLPVGRDLPRPQTYGVMAGAAAALNVHGNQDGFTMRTFEAAGVGAVQLIDRVDVAMHYEPGVEVAVFSNAEEATELARRALTDTSWAEGIRAAGRRRTLAEHTFDHRVTALEELWS